MTHVLDFLAGFAVGVLAVLGTLGLCAAAFAAAAQRSIAQALRGRHQ